MLRRRVGSLIAGVTSGRTQSFGWRSSQLPAQPGLLVGNASISLPLNDMQVPIIRAACEQAPYGLGHRTVVDTSVRNVLQVKDSESVCFTNPKWAAALEESVAEAADSLGLPRDAVTASFYKLLLYEPGSFFSAHTDTEKANGMFGTLIVQLPSAYKGGLVTVRHNSEDEEFALGADTGDAEYACHCLAHYADCEHEVAPVQSGLRLVAIYSLCWAPKRWAPKRWAPSVPKTDPLVPRLAQVMSEVPAADRQFMLQLEHQYTETSLIQFGVNALKGNDRARLIELQKATKNEPLAYHLALATVQEDEYEIDIDNDDRERGRYVATLDGRDKDIWAYQHLDHLVLIPEEGGRKDLRLRPRTLTGAEAELIATSPWIAHDGGVQPQGNVGPIIGKEYRGCFLMATPRLEDEADLHQQVIEAFYNTLIPHEDRAACHDELGRFWDDNDESRFWDDRAACDDEFGRFWDELKLS